MHCLEPGNQKKGNMGTFARTRAKQGMSFALRGGSLKAAIFVDRLRLAPQRSKWPHRVGGCSAIMIWLLDRSLGFARYRAPCLFDEEADDLSHG